MIWNHPAALIGLVLLAGPVLVHLLVRRHAARVVFPAMRFVPPVRAAAVRLRSPSDRALLLLRLTIVAAAVLATAQPVLLTAARQRALQSRVARAIVVDTSASVPAEAAARLADAAAADVFVSRRFAGSDMRDANHRAMEWLSGASAARREVAIVSDFQRGSIDEADLVFVPATTGIRLLRAGRPNTGKSGAVIEGWRGARWDGALALGSTSTQVTWTRAGASTFAGLTVRAAASDRAAAERATAAARSFGVPKDERSRPIEVSFAGADGGAVTPPVTSWIASAAIALQTSPLLAEANAQVDVGERDGVMSVKTTLPGSSPLAPALIRAALLAAAPAVADTEAETAAIDDAVLAQWQRAPTPIARALPRLDQSDGRWLWTLVAGLLLVETLLGRRGTAVQQEVSSSALHATGGTRADAA
jgi:Aerotolerance regulator N-terminal